MECQSSSLHCSISLSCCSFWYSGVCYEKISYSKRLKILLNMSARLSAHFKTTLRNILNCNKTYKIESKIDQWRLLILWIRIFFISCKNYFNMSSHCVSPTPSHYLSPKCFFMSNQRLMFTV